MIHAAASQPEDFACKRLFSFIMFLFTLTETGDKQGAPIITFPWGNEEAFVKE